MLRPTQLEILRLYKQLIRYGNQLKLTNRSYFLGRIRREFRQNRDITDPAEVEFNFKLLRRINSNMKHPTTLFNYYCVTTLRPKSIYVDYSLYPQLNEDEIEETFVRGSGPGGQAVNKTSNCVVLRHLPTNIVIKCHTHRIASRNCVEARRLLLEKLDKLYNGERAVAAQLQALENKKIKERKRRQQKNQELKKNWKEREGSLNKCEDTENGNK